MAFDRSLVDACCSSFNEGPGAGVWWDEPTGRLLAGVGGMIVIKYCPWCGADWEKRLKQAVRLAVLQFVDAGGLKAKVEFRGPDYPGILKLQAAKSREYLAAQVEGDKAPI